ncbi:hypothetical protein DB44_GT00030 [Candidatus Protochlamydia amoebophila]|uniref:Uncharacterized protein n=1 Tax=Candidatus Protochlamydia amoebophila TaxID=362787 RepID=A0A0C1GYL1_9BACT|nr:hypothetical protein DB44_GT00030 [Candidatus Protochlamydia amoebophila]
MDNLTSWVWDGDVVQIAEGFGDGVAGQRMPDGGHVNPLVAEDENIKAADERFRGGHGAGVSWGAVVEVE